MQNNDFWIRKTCLYGSLTSLVDLWMLNSVLISGMTLVYCSQPSFVVLRIHNRTLTSELLVSRDPSPHLWLFHAKQRLQDQNYNSLSVPDLNFVFCIQNSDFSTRIASLYWSQPPFVAFACKTAALGPELQVSMGPRPHRWFFAFKTANLAQELRVSMGPCPHLWFLHAKQRRLDKNYKSPWVPDLTWRFVHAKQRD